jgi:hypothetical protein
MKGVLGEFAENDWWLKWHDAWARSRLTGEPTLSRVWYFRSELAARRFAKRKNIQLEEPT